LILLGLMMIFDILLSTYGQAHQHPRSTNIEFFYVIHKCYVCYTQFM